jgi:hypothetical protein
VVEASVLGLFVEDNGDVIGCLDGFQYDVLQGVSPIYIG